VTEDDPQPANPVEPRELIAELDGWLADQEPGTHGGHVLAFATEWVYKDVEGLDVPRLTEEVERFILSTPMPDRVLVRYENDVVTWLSNLMMLDAQYQPQPAAARETLAAVRRQIAQRANLLSEEGFSNVASGFRRLLDETVGGEPPGDRIWRGVALRIAEPYLADPVDPVPQETPRPPVDEP
jgi:hypothetical protein